MKKLKLKIHGMHCTSCEMLIREALNEIGVKSNIDYKTGITIIEYDEKKANEKKIIETIEKEGYKVEK